MGSETHSFSGHTLQEMSRDQRRAFVEAITHQEWLREWLLEVYEQPTQAHVIESDIPHWDAVVAFFDDSNVTHQARRFHSDDKDETQQWRIILDREKKQLVIEFFPNEYNSTVMSEDIAALSNRIQFYQDHPVWYEAGY